MESYYLMESRLLSPLITTIKLDLDVITSKFQKQIFVQIFLASCNASCSNRFDLYLTMINTNTLTQKKLQYLFFLYWQTDLLNDLLANRLGDLIERNCYIEHAKTIKTYQYKLLNEVINVSLSQRDLFWCKSRTLQ